MFIALKYGAAAMAGATAYHLYMKQNGRLDPNMIAAAKKQRELEAMNFPYAS